MKFLTTMTMLAMLGLLAFAAADADAATKNELKQRFKDRYPTLVALKNAGKVGEVHDGYVAAVNSDYLNDPADPGAEDSPTVAEFLGAENADRRALYEILAEETDSTPQKVARRNAQRNFENAAPEHYLKPADRDWVRKKNL